MQIALRLGLAKVSLDGAKGDSYDQPGQTINRTSGRSLTSTSFFPKAGPMPSPHRLGRKGRQGGWTSPPLPACPPSVSGSARPPGTGGASSCSEGAGRQRLEQEVP